MTDKQSNKRPAPQQAYDGTQSSQPYGDAHGQGHGLFHPLMIPGSIGVSDEGQYPLRHAPHHAVGQHIHLFSHAQPRLEGDAVYSHERIQYRKGNIFKERHQAGRETGRQHSHRHSLRKHGLSGNERQAGAFPFTNKHPYKIQQRKYVGKAGGNGGAQHLPSRGQKYEHKQGIQRHVQQAAQSDACAGMEGAAFGPNQMTQQGSHRSRKSPQCHGAEQVFLGQRMYLRIRAPQQIDKGICPDISTQAVKCGNAQTAPQRKRRGIPGFLSIAVSHGAGNDAGPADAEQIGNGGKKHKRRHTDSDGGKHGITPRKAYKKSIRHVVQHQNDLAQHRRKSQLPDGLWNRGAFKQFLFSDHTGYLLAFGCTV